MPDPDSMLHLRTTFRRPAPGTRFMFALSCHRLAVSLATLAITWLLATGIGAVMAQLTDKRLFVVMLMLLACLGAVAARIALSTPWLSQRATPDHLDAALWSATPTERRHLLAQIESRLRNPYWTSAMTLSELTALFTLTREKHGDRAQRRQTTDARARAAQQKLLADLASRAKADGAQWGQSG